MSNPVKSISALPEASDFSANRFFADLVAARKPMVLRGLVSDWPLVQYRDDEAGFINALRGADSGHRCYALVAPPEVNGRLFYGANLTGTNFNTSTSTVSDALTHLTNQKALAQPYAIALQAATLKDALPNLATSHTTAFTQDVDATFWLSNQSFVAPHFDLYDNIACVTHGEREFILFPPEQIANLYVGPTVGAPGGVPISTVDFDAPDFEQHPRFKQALQSAQSATLQPGDAIYIPSPWWHAVRAKMPINLLINFWWPTTDAVKLKANQSLMHAMLSIAQLPKDERLAWRAFFDYLVFKPNGEPTEHWPDGVIDVATELDGPDLEAVLDYLKQGVAHR